MVELVNGQLQNRNPWYAARVRSNGETKAQNALSQKGFETFFPTSIGRRAWSDRVKTISVPLFSGYVFCRFDRSDILEVMKTYGVQTIVSTSDGPSPIDAAEMMNLQTAVWSKMELTPYPFLSVGEWVTVIQGPLSGVEGLLTERKGEFRIVVSIGLLQRSISAEMDANWVRPCKQETFSRCGFLGVPGSVPASRALALQ